MKYIAFRFDSVTDELKKTIPYDSLKRAMTYAKKTRDNVSIRDRETQEIIMVFRCGQLIHPL